MNLTQAIDGYLLFKTAAGLSPRSITLYAQKLKQFAAYLDNPPVETIVASDVIRFLSYLRTDYRPQRLTGDDAPLSSQSVYNSWTALKSFYRWAVDTLDVPDVMAGIPRPKVTNTERAPFTQAEVKRLLSAVQPTKARRPRSGKRFIDALRDRAIILTLLDTGIRAGELCALTIADLHLAAGRLTVTGKGNKSRYVWIGAVTRPAIWRYLQERQPDPALPLFASGTTPLSISWLRKRLAAIGRSVDVPDCHPHRFRYTFAVQYLRNGGDIFTLQALLGHSSLTMVQYYLKLAQTDIEEAHRRASPVDRWLRP